MAKPTTENLTLPDFPVTIVRKLAGNFIHDEINLQEMIANTDKGLILYFYPKDSTPGCTTQATEFTAHLHEFDDLGYDIIGVSRDSVESHEKFITKYDLNIALIGDTDEKLCQYFDVIKEKNMYGKKVLGIERSTFVLDANGHIVHEWRKVKAAGHAQAVLDALKTA